MQLEWVQAFLGVVDHHGFAAASVQLYRSQGRISTYIAALEREIGAQLFDREHRPARLTAAGAEFVSYARAIVADFDAGRAAVAGVQSLTRGDVTIAVYPSAGASFLPEVLRRFSEQSPGIRVELVEQAVRGIDDSLESGPALLAIRPTLPPPRNAHSFGRALLWRERMCLVVPTSHGLANRGEATIADLQSEQLVVSGHNLHHDTEAIRLLAGKPVAPKIRFLSDQPQILVGLVRSGLALGFSNELALESVRVDGVAVLPIAPALYREVGVYWAAGYASSPSAVALLATIRETPVPRTTIDLRGIDEEHPHSGS